MRIRRIDIEAFGCLSDFSAGVAPGLHVFFGPNEAGKSTLQQAILALLYGFYAGDRARPAESAPARCLLMPAGGMESSCRLESA